MERRIQLGHSPRVCGPRLVQVRGRVPGVARPEGVQQGWGAAAEGHGVPRPRQLQGFPHGQGPARPVGLMPLHPLPVEGRLRADEPRPDSVHDPGHGREQRRGPRSIQGADGREGGLVEESPRTARQVTPCGSVRLCHRVRHQAPDGRLLRFAAGPGVSRPIPPSALHGTWGSAKGGGGWGSGREHVRQVRNGCGVPQVHVSPKKGSAPGPARSCEGACAPSMRRCRASSSVRLRGPAGGSGQGHMATWAHGAHLLAPVDAAEDTVSHSRRAGRCAGGGRAATKGRDGGARGRPTSVGGGPGSPAGGRGRGAGSPCPASSAGPPATCRRGESRGRGRRR